VNSYGPFLLAALAAYLIGAFPTGVVATKLAGAPDVRHTGSGHTGGTNTMRLAGPWVGVTVVLIDAIKGFVAWFAALWIMGGNPFALPVAATAAIIGHCWPVYTRFVGGMGLATAGGLLIILQPMTIAFAVPVWAILFFGVFKKKYSPRCVTIAIPVAIALNIALFSPAPARVWMLVLLAAVLVIRHLPEWNRVE